MRRLNLSLLGSKLLILVVLLGAPAFAQSPPGELKDVSTFKVQSAGFGVSARDCGLARDEAIEAFSEPLREAGISLVTSSSGYWLSLQVTTLVMEGTSCITHIETAAYQSTRYFNTATREERVGKIQHWMDGMLFVSGQSAHSRSVLRGFRQMGAKLAEKWRDDQS